MRRPELRVDDVGVPDVVPERDVVRGESHQRLIGLGGRRARTTAQPIVDDLLPARIGRDFERVVEADLLERPPRPADAVARSEEHTSELQSLMRNSYAVSFLIKK